MKIYSFIVLLLLITSCNSIKRSRLISAGEVTDEAFYDSVHFDFDAEFPIIKASINGIPSTFLFDTGAPNVISKELAEKLNLKTIATGWVSDSGGNISKKEYVRLAKIKIGNVDFLNMGAAIVDLKSAHKINCLNIDGIIGANLMRKAFWKIDYDNQILWFSNRLNNFELDKNYKVIPFKSRFSGTPIVKLNINNTDSINMIIDTGSNGNLTLPLASYKRPENNKEIEYFVGTSTYGISGKADADSTFYLKADNFSLGEVSCQNKILQYRGNTDLIGNAFLKNYSIIIDWNEDVIYMKPNSEYDYSKLEHFGFKLDYENQKMVVCALYNNSKAAKLLQLGDEVIQIDEFDFEHFSNENFCEYNFQKVYDYKSRDEINIKIKRQSKVLDFKLEKQVFLEYE